MESLTKNGNRVKGNTGHQNVKPLEQTSFNTTEVIMPGIVEPEGFLVRTRVLNDLLWGR
ncbi:MAG: hypothetical protein ABIN80_04130 [Dyadobacter sp.]|uniref:hypothetical protein n=1 Tax=Dyadobacter sp. TaxID=1914288 RepID=UPI003267875B